MPHHDRVLDTALSPADADARDGDALAPQHAQHAQHAAAPAGSEAGDAAPRLDCWTQDRARMVGARPCMSEGLAVPGSAKVALLFLVVDEVPAEPVWAAFLATAGELALRTPVPPPQPSPPPLLPAITPDPENVEADCWKHGWSQPLGVPPRRPYQGEAPPPIENATEWIQHQCSTGASGHELYTQQDLFSVYVHRRRGAHVAPRDSVFASRDIHYRFNTSYAEATLVAAHRALLAAALQDPRNAMFVLLSDSCVPLHHPAVIWSQLLAESHISRVSQGAWHSGMWHGSMHTPHLGGGNFMKSSQWSTLTRMHAQLAAEDEHVWPQFAQFCRTLESCEDPSRSRFCISDEHFVPTLLNAYGMADSIDRMGRGTATDWSRAGWHPATYYPGNATEHIAKMRKLSDAAMCLKGLDKTMRSVVDLFTHTPRCTAPQGGITDDATEGMPPAPAPPRRQLASDPATQHTPARPDGGCAGACMHACVRTCMADGAYGCTRACGAVCTADCAAQHTHSTQHAGVLRRSRIAARQLRAELRDDGAGSDDDDPDGGQRNQKQDSDLGEKQTQKKGSGGSGAPEGEVEEEEEEAEENEKEAEEKEEAEKEEAEKEEEHVVAPEDVPVPEVGDERDAHEAKWAAAIRREMQENLRAQGWLRGFEPMSMHCPLFGRKVSAEAVPQFAEAAWRCDGLGFAWECLTQGADASG